MIQPKLSRIEPFYVAGLQTRTTNHDEANEQTAKIAPLWQQFFSEAIAEKTPNTIANSGLYGVYSNYAGGIDDPYTVTAGVAANLPVTPFASTLIEAGDYLVFEAQGTFPEAVIQAWGEVWAYFEQATSAKRKFATDFELYRGPDEVAIHIGIIS